MQKAFKRSLCLGLILYSVTAFAQPTDLSVSAIPAALKENADVVTRYESVSLVVDGISDATITTHLIVTALNEKGRGILNFQEATTKYIILKNAEIKVYDSLGHLKEKFKKKDLQTSGIGEGLIEDGFVVYKAIRPDAYPITVEFEYEVKYNGTSHLPTYYVSGNNHSVEQSYF